MAKNKKEKPNFSEWYNSLSKPSKRAFRYGVLFAIKMQKDAELLKQILETTK